MKTIKRLISVLLVALLVISTSPVSAFANEEIPEEQKIYGNDFAGYEDANYYLEQFEWSGGSECDNAAARLVKWNWNPNTKTLYVYSDEEGACFDSFYDLKSYPIYYVYSDEEVAEMDAKGAEHDDGYWDNIEPVFFRFEHLVIGKNIEKISGLYLNHFEYLQDVTFDEESSLKVLGGYIFDGATNTRQYYTCDFEIPDSVEELEDSAFICSTFDTLTLPPSVKKIGKYCFSNSDIKSIDLSQTQITDLPDYCFSETETLEQVSLPNTIQSIGDGVFCDCSQLQFGNMVIPNGVKSIGEEAFWGCQFESLTLPKSLESIGKSCFAYAKINQTLDMSNTDVTVIPESCFEEYETQGNTVLLPQNTETIEKNAFHNSNIKSIVLPAAVTSVNYYAFQDCDSLQVADLSAANIRELHSTFYGCGRLTEVLLPDSLTAIDSAFMYCSSLESFDIPPNVISICGLNGTKIKHLDNLENIPTTIKSIEINNFTDEKYDFSEFTNGFEVGDYFLWENEYVEEFTFPKSNFSTIGSSAFMDCENLNKVTIHTCETIKQRAFKGTNLREVNIPNSCTSIGKEAFADIPYLKKVRLSSNLESVGSGLFKNDLYLKTVIYPSKKKLKYNGSSTSRVYQTMYNDGFLLNEGLTVYCYPDTFIEGYCQQYDINYGYIGESPEAPEEPEEPEPEKPDPSLTRSGTWENGIWYITANRLFIECNEPGTINSKVFTNQNGNSLDLSELIIEFNIRNIEFAGTAATVIPDNYMLDFAYENGMEDRELTIYFGSSITKIGKNAFRNSNVYSIDCTHGVSDIGEYAFADNPKLNSVQLGFYIHELKEGVFYNCNITSINISSDIQKIGKKALTDFHANRNISVTISPCTVELFGDPNAPWNNSLGTTGEGYKDEQITFYVDYGSVAYRYVKDWGLNYIVRNGTGIETEEEINAPPKYDITEPETPSPDDPQPPAPVSISGFYTTDEKLKKGEKPGKWTYRYDTKTLFIKGGTNFNSYDFYYSDNTKMQKGDLEVDTLVMQSSFTAIYGEVIQEQYNYSYGFSPAIYSNTTLSFFNPKVVDYSSCKMYGFYKGAFDNCTRLESIVIPSGARFGAKQFVNTPALRSVVFESRESILQEFFKGTKSIEFIKLPDDVYSIGANAFSYCTDLQQIEIPDSCATIGMKAFYKCVSVQSITLGKNLNHIGKDAFGDIAYCERINVNTDKLKNQSVSESNKTPFKGLGVMTNGASLVFGDDVTKADCELFKEAKITSLTLGKNVSEIKGIESLEYLEEIIVDSENNNFYSENGILYQGTKLVLAPRNLTDITIKAGTTEIGDAAFYKTKAKSVKIPQGVTKIGDYAFSQSDTLKSVTLNRGVESIGECAFEFCTKLKTILMPNGLKTIGRCAFEGCTILASVILNEQLETIGFDAFRGCEALRGIVIPQSVQLIRIGAFENCTALEYAYIWDSTIEEDAFAGDDNLVIYTMLASKPYQYAKLNGIEYTAYTDEDAFFTETALKLDIEAGYIGYCNGEHGEIEWLTVTEADCENDGYMIGVCEYCSEILDERHIDAYGHDYQAKCVIEPSATVRGGTVYECSKCHSSKIEYSQEGGESPTITTQTVSGRVVIADNKNLNSGVSPAKRVSVIEGENALAQTDENGNFTLELESGVHTLTLRYTFGFDRKIIVAVENEDIECGEIPIIGCDFNKDGSIDDGDTKLFRIALSTKKNDPAYLDYIDLNNDGIINARDYVILRTFNSYTKDNTSYEWLTFQ